MNTELKKRYPAILSGQRRWLVSLVAAGAIFQVLTAAAVAFATRELFIALAQRTPEGIPGPALVIIIASGCILAVLQITERGLTESIGQDYVADLRWTIFRHLSRLPTDKIESTRRGSLIMRFVGDMAAIKNWVSQGVAKSISLLVILPGLVSVMLLLDLTIGILVAAVLSINLLLIAGFSSRAENLHSRQRQSRSRLAIAMSERLPIAPELRLLGRIPTERRKFYSLSKKLKQHASNRVRLLAFLQSMPDIGNAIAVAVIALVSINTGNSTATMASLLAMLALTRQPQRDVANLWDRYQSWQVAIEKCNRLLNRTAIKRPRVPNSTFELHPPEVFIKGAVLDEKRINIQYEACKLHILPPHLAEKRAELLQMIAGLRKPRHGQVLVGDRSPIALTGQMRAQLVCYLHHQSPILKGSLRRALTMGVSPAYPDDDIIKVAQQFGLAEFMHANDGLASAISESGKNLTGREHRCLLLARAALAQAKLLLIDDISLQLSSDSLLLLRKLVNEYVATVLIASDNPDLTPLLTNELKVADTNDIGSLPKSRRIAC